jgi:hypothetical protein
MPRPISDYACAFIGIALGVFCMLQTQAATKNWMDPIVATCTQGEATHFERMLKDGIVPYNPNLGGGFVCLITQFLNALQRQYPGGLLTWGGVMVVSIPFAVFSAVEAGRFGAKGPVRYSVVIGLLAQFLGVCVVMPGIWIPSYVFGGSRDGPFHPNRPMAGVYTSIPATLLAIGIFVLDPTSAAWRNCAGVLGGPIVALLPLFFYLSPTPTSTKDMLQNEGAAKASYAKAFQYMAVLSLAGWITLVYVAFSVYGFNVKALVNGLWFEAHPAVKFMTIDTSGFFIATLIYAYLQGANALLKMLVLVPVAGPGAALCITQMQAEPRYQVPKEKK